ncbi:MAG TPA: extracellular solute-binding protein [Chloroflexota bacterium]|nr:extracellular solute-binding protein [Chloroflexota bacterium]
MIPRPSWARIAASLCLLVAASACSPAASAPTGQAPASAPAPSATAPAAVAAPNGAATWPPAVQRLIDGARAEGELDLVLSATFFKRGEALPQIQQAFNQRYGLNVRIQRTVGPTMPQLAALLGQEVQAGKKPQTDLFLGSDIHISTLLRAGALEPIDWRALDSRIPAMAVSEGNVGLAYGSSYSGMTYNQNLIPPAEVPSTLQSLLDPKWKGKIASTPFAAGFPQLARSTAWGEPRTTAYVQALADQVGGLMRCGENERLLSGEFVLYALNCGVASDLAAHRDGQPIGVVIPTDALAVSYYAWGVPKGSAHPNAATLFALFMVSDEGQRLSYDADLMDLHLLPGSQSIGIVKPMLDQGGKLMGEDAMVQMTTYGADSGRLESELQRMIAKQ